MQVTIDIDDGGKARKALPLRAVPYITSWRESPDSIVRTLAAPKIQKFRNGLAARLRHNELFAYQMGAQGNVAQVQPSQWESWVVTLDSLTKKSKADEREGAENENHAPWRIKAVLELPDNVFIWLDEFQHWYSSTRPHIYDGPELPDVENVTTEDVEGFIGKEDDTLDLMPIFPPEIENRVWRFAEDFFAAGKVKTAASPSGDGKPWLIADPADPKPAQHWYIPARYFARQLIKEKPTLMKNKPLLAKDVYKLLDNAGIKKRGGKKPPSADTILKAFSNISFG